MEMESVNKQIGRRIKIARISRNLSQDSIAEDLGVSVSAYSNMERGAVDITVNRIMRVSEILKVKWHYLLGISGESEMDFEKSLEILTESKNTYPPSKTSNPVDIEKEIKQLKDEIGKLKKKKSSIK